MKLKQLSIRFRLKVKKLFLDIRHSHIKDLRNLILQYLKKLPNIVHLRNLVLFNSILAIVVIVLFYQRFTALAPYYQNFTPNFGGYYREGVIGNTEKINPLFILNDAEAVSNRLVFSGLTRVLPNNEIIPDLAESWKAEQDDTVYTFNLKKGVKWHDGKEFTADDVLFTINLIQNPDTKTPRSTVWKGVLVEKIDNEHIRFTLQGQYPEFLEVASQPILPQHLLKQIEPKNIKIAEFNKKPIGTGPYKFVRFDHAANETEVIFGANGNFALGKPYIQEVRLKGYDTFENLYNGLIRKQIDGVTEIPNEKISKINLSNLNLNKFYLPRYQSLIFNLKNSDLQSKDVRKAISYAINRKNVIDKAVNGEALPVYSAILPGQVGYDSKFKSDNFDIGKANETLENSGWKVEGDYRKKDGKELSLRLIASDDQESVNAAKEIQLQLKSIGVKINIEQAETGLIQANFIRPRNYDILLIGQNLGLEADLYGFWHSSQIADPGLNLSGFNDRKVDKLLEQGRKSPDKTVRADKYKQVQEVLVEEVPVIYLYNPIYSVAVSKKVKGYSTGRISNSVDRISSIYKWYVKEKVNY